MASTMWLTSGRGSRAAPTAGVRPAWRASAVVSAALMPRWNVPLPSLDQ
ncbi:hypothetical protein ACGFY6_30515 [Streptomyces sp. NPDC048387]